MPSMQSPQSFRTARLSLFGVLYLLGAGVESVQNMQASVSVSVAHSGSHTQHKASFVPPLSISQAEADAPIQARFEGFSGASALQTDPTSIKVDPLTSARLMGIPGATVLEQAQGPTNTAAAATQLRAVVSPMLEPPDAGTRSATTSTNQTPSAEDVYKQSLRTYCSASFAGGLTVGVVFTLLVLSLGVDRLPAKKAGLQAAVSSATSSMPQQHAPESGVEPERHDAAEASRVVERGTDSVESIHKFGPRCSFLMAMLLVQSLSSLMLAGFQDLIQNQPSIVFFLTMIVGTGGNVGGQSVVLAVRRLAYGEQVSLSEQLGVGVQLAAVLAPMALARAYVQGTKLAVCLTIGLSTILIVILAAALGTALPKLLNQVKVDPAHATPVIQVLMDMVGVLVTCVIGHVVLDMMLTPPS